MGETMRSAELALGSSERILEDWQFQKASGWHWYWTPDGAVALAARSQKVKRLIWC